MARPKISPKVWRPPTAQKPHPDPLPKLTVVQVNGFGAEDVLVEKGHVFTGVEDGRILRLTPDGRRLDMVADTRGRPLGLELYPDGRLLVCDSKRGLLLVDRQSGDLEVLVPRGPDLRVCNNAAVAADGTVYFTDSTSRFDLDHWKADLLEHSGTGRLLRRTPDGQVDVLLSGLQFANGVALAPDESWVVVASTGSYRLDRVELPSGKHSTLVEALPAFPDNIATGSDGLVWVAMASPRIAALDLAHRLHPAIRKAVWALPEPLQVKEKRVVWVRAVDGATGKVVHDFRSVHPDYHMVTGVREDGGVVYLGSLNERAIAYFSLP
ncbi:SMP-30/gluconolactonase/LRE family protein [Actinophytocola algeriensis]|uniref:Sugar lactone lactonase YvrE n=1 Tax=Actinophytocola algeriensis TaxID=1768010 RepID=A0A7W7VBW5_9PSEU|nr:SMP-30/gluconolactonase/LRE family protein [Actinophytocola algeriensis]MBB4904454.1 sugar lactone lactonase YvrE [Actinophytocola algeriensis]MBE1476687.1 sugar lactone lactonase YvrE [Actinophytocola algeriensis]